MNRASFLRSLFVIAVSPKILAEIKPTAPLRVANPLFEQLMLLTPSYYKDFVEKYGNEDFTWWLAELGEQPLVESRKFHFFENKNWEASTSPIAGEPVTITLTKGNYI